MQLKIQQQQKKTHKKISNSVEGPLILNGIIIDVIILEYIFNFRKSFGS